MENINLDKDVKIRDVNYYFRELYGVINPLNEDDAKRRSELIRTKRRDSSDESTFASFAVSHYWNKCLVELNRKES